MKRLCIVMVCAGLLGACGGALQDGAGAPPAAASDAFVARTGALAGGADDDDGEPVNIDALAVTAQDDTEAPALNK